MKISELLASPPIKTTKDLGDMEDHLEANIWDIPEEKRDNEHVEMRYYVDECFDGERGFEVVSFWFKNQPVMLGTRGGRSNMDTEGCAILDAKLYNAMLRYIDTLKDEPLYEHIAHDVNEDYDALGFVYGECTLHHFYKPEGVKPKYHVGDIVIVEVDENHLKWNSPKIETRVKIEVVRKYNPGGTYSGTQIDRRWDDSKGSRKMITDVGKGYIGAHFGEAEVIRKA